MEEAKDLPQQEVPQIQTQEQENASAEAASQVNEQLTAEAARIAELEAQLAQARQEANENWDKFLRVRADVENIRKRQDRVIVERVQQQKKALLHKLLGVLDNVERALIYQDTLDRQGLQQALRMMQWQLSEVMRG